MANSLSANATAGSSPTENVHQNPLNNLGVPLDTQKEHTVGRGHKRNVANMPQEQQYLPSIQDNAIAAVTLPPNNRNTSNSPNSTIPPTAFDSEGRPVYEFYGPTGKCFLCKVELTSSKLAIEHLKGQKHFKKLASQSMFSLLKNSPSPPSGPVAASPVQRLPILRDSPILEIQPAIRQDLQGAVMRNLGPNGEPYIMNGTRGFCYVCDLELTSVAHKDSHTLGAKHRKKCLVYNVTSNNNLDAGSSKVLMCTICKVPFSCRDNAAQHFMSDKHKKQVIALGVLANVDYNYDPEQTKRKHIVSSSQMACTTGNEPLLNTEDRTTSSVRVQNSTATSSSNSVESEEKMPGLVPEWSNREVDPPASNSSNSSFQASCTELKTFVGRTPSGENESNDMPEVQDSQNIDLKRVEKMSYKDVPLPASENEKVGKRSQKDGTLLSPKNETVYMNPYIKRLHLPSQQLTNNELSIVDNSQVSGCSPSRESETPSATDRNRYFQHRDYSGTQNKEAFSQPEYSSSYYADSSVDVRSYGNEHLLMQIPYSIPFHSSSRYLHDKQSSGGHLENAPPVQGNVKIESEAKHNQNQGTEGYPVAVVAVNNFHANQSAAQIQSAEGIQKSKLEASNSQHIRNEHITVHGQTEAKAQMPLPLVPLPARPNEMGSAAEKKLYNFNGNYFLCSTCNVVLLSETHFQQHLNEEKHQEKMATSWKMHQPSQQSTSPLSPQLIFGPKKEVQEIDNSMFVHFSGSRGFCHACNLELTSRQHKQQHIEGKPHVRSVERARLAQAGKVYSLNCDICGKRFTGQESAQQHFTSDKHTRKKEISQGTVIPQMDWIEDCTVVQKGPDRWFHCNVCKCFLNTKEQLDIHKQSVRHLAQAEKQENMTQFELVQEVETRAGAIVSPKLFEDLSVKEVERDATLSSRETSPGLLGLFQNRERILQQNLQHLEFKEGPIFNTGNPQNLQNLEHGGPIVSAGITQRSGSSKQPGAVAYVPVLSESERRFTHLSQQSDYGSALRPQPGTVKDATVAAREVENCTFNSNAHVLLGQTNFNRESGGSVGVCTNGLPARNEDNTRSTGSNENAFGTGSAATGNRIIGRTQAIGSMPVYGPECTEISGSIDTMTAESGYPGSENKVNGIMRRPNMKATTKGSKRGVRSSISMESSRTDDNFESDEEEEDEDQIPPSNFNIINEEDLSLGLSNLAIAVPKPERSFHPNHKFFCKFCNKHMNTLREWKSHINGQTHMWNMSCTKAPERRLEAVKKTRIQEVHDRAFKVTKNLPRSYQVELLEKTMAGDSVVYLPTGTGKTMVAVQAIAIMLQENPSRPTIFLVDKVLLVIQQAKYIKSELEKRKFLRPSLTKEGELEEREPLVLAVSGGLMSKGGIPMWKNDIIVTTADFCMNMLDKHQIQWKDFSLAVMDEVHHCIKRHPYHRLLSDFHYELSQNTRPKILGLTASPAGKKTMELTYEMLCCLLIRNLGGAKIAIVEEKNSLDELSLYESSAQLHSECVPMTSSEKTFMMEFLKYFLRCYSKLASMSSSLQDTSIHTLCYFNPVIDQANNESIIKDVAERLLKDSQPLNEILQYIYEAKCSNEADRELNIQFDHLRMYIEQLLLCFSNITIGLEMDELEKLLKPEEGNPQLQVVKSLKLPFDEMYKRFLSFSEEKDNNLPSMQSKLLETLENPSFIDWKEKSSKALVLVRERKQARLLRSMLRNCRLAREKRLHATHLVGHGKNAKDGGMKVTEQKRVLDNTDKYQILVATSIAEEGLDLQTLQLVVSLNPPTSVTGLVQMRGRARKKGSHFVILCDSQEQVEKLETLQLYEKNMMDAARKFSREHRQ